MNIKDNVAFADSQHLLYPSGHNIVEYHMQDQVQKFFPGLESSNGITAFCISPHKK